jgi:peptide deformylase
VSIRIIRTGNDPILRQVAKAVPEVTKAIEKLLDDMAETMYDAEGIGLAAVQIGVAKRVIVVDIGEDGPGLIELINPEIVAESGSDRASEGCLSLPGAQGDVTRPANVTVRGMNRQGEIVEYEATGMLARCLQHEVDHLNGILFTDYLKPSDIVYPSGQGNRR